jgi:hypothetical protein
MEAHDAITRPGPCFCSRSLIDGRLAVGSARRADDVKAGVQFLIPDLTQFPGKGGGRREGGEAVPGVIVVGLEVFAHQRFEQLQPFGRQLRLLYQDLSQRLALVEHPGVHGRDQGIAADEIQLQRQNGKQQIAVGGQACGG